MQGYRIGLCEYLSYKDVFIYSVVYPPAGCFKNNDVQSVVLPQWIADKFKNNHRLHTVVTDMQGRFIEENNLVSR